MSGLTSIADKLWIAAAPTRFLCFEVGTRMTLVRLGDGRLWLHSPIPMDAALLAEIRALGDVAFIVCPNDFHHLYAQAAVEAFPNAQLFGPKSLAKKRKDLRFTAHFDGHTPEAWQADLTAIAINGSLLNETVFYHSASQTLISSDLLENFHHCDHAPTRWWLKIGDCYGKANWHRLLRITYTQRKAARQSIDSLLALPLKRIIIAHGELIEDNANEVLRQGMAWLK